MSTRGQDSSRRALRRSFTKPGLELDPKDAEWMSQKACGILDADLFDASPYEGERSKDFRERVTYVDWLCNTNCQVRAACFEYGVRCQLRGIMFGGIATKENLGNKKLVFVGLQDLRYHGCGPATIQPAVTAETEPVDDAA